MVRRQARWRRDRLTVVHVEHEIGAEQRNREREQNLKTMSYSSDYKHFPRLNRKHDVDEDAYRDRKSKGPRVVRDTKRGPTTVRPTDNYQV